MTSMGLKFFTVAIILATFLPLSALAQEQPQELTPAERLATEREPDLDAQECEDSQSAYNIADDSGGGSFVPVHEVGNLLSLSRQNTGLTFQICMYLKVIKRIQYRFEEKEFIINADARKAAGKAINKYTEAFLEQSDQQYNVSPGITGVIGNSPEEPFADPNQNKQSVVANFNNIRKDDEKEVYGVINDDVVTSGSIFKTELQTNLAIKETRDLEDQTRFTNKINSDFTREQYDSFLNDFNQGGWSAFLNFLRPDRANNPISARLLLDEELNRRKEIVWKNRELELLSGQGLLATRECEEGQWTSDGKYCRKWKVKEPAAANAARYVQAITSALRQVEQADQIGEDFLKDEIYDIQRNNSPLIDAYRLGLADRTTRTTALNSSIYNGPDPCSGSGPLPSMCYDTGWDGNSGLTGYEPPISVPPIPTLGGDGNGNGIPDILEGNRDILNRFLDRLPADIRDRINGLLQGGGDYQQIIDILEEQPPVITFQFSTPTLSQVNSDPTRNKSIISWAAFNANECFADNYWLSGGDVLNSPNKKLRVNGIATINHPILFSLSFAGSNDQRDLSNLIHSEYDRSLLNQTQSLIINNNREFSPVPSNYALEIDPALPFPADQTGNNLGKIEVSGTFFDTRSLITALKNIYDGLSPTERTLRGINSHQFTFTTRGNTGPQDINSRGYGKVDVSITPTYRIRCTNTNGEIADETVTITREP